MPSTRSTTLAACGLHVLILTQHPTPHSHPTPNTPDFAVSLQSSSNKSKMLHSSSKKSKMLYLSSSFAASASTRISLSPQSVKNSTLNAHTFLAEKSCAVMPHWASSLNPLRDPSPGSRRWRRWHYHRRPCSPSLQSSPQSLPSQFRAPTQRRRENPA